MQDIDNIPTLSAVNPIKIDRLLFADNYSEVLKRVAYYLMGKNRYDVIYFKKAEQLLEKYFKKETSKWSYDPKTLQLFMKPIEDKDFIYRCESMLTIEDEMFDLRDVDSFRLVKIKSKNKRILSTITFNLKDGSVITDLNSDRKLSTTDFFNILHKVNMEVFNRIQEIKYPGEESEEVIQTFNLRISKEEV